MAFHPTTNLIASCSDDRKIKLWKYTNEVAWEHSTITGHRNNVSSLVFHDKSGYLISDSEDKTVRLWNYETKTALHTHKAESDRYWMVRLSKNGNLLAAGHDSGVEVFEVNKEVVPWALIGGNLLVFSQGMKTLIQDIEKNVQKEELYQYAPKDKNAIFFISRLMANPFDSSIFMAQVEENGEKTFQVKKKESYLNYPNMIKSFVGLDSCFISRQEMAVLANPSIIHLQKIAQDDKRKVLRLGEEVQVVRIFSSDKENELILTTTESILKYNLMRG